METSSAKVVVAVDDTVDNLELLRRIVTPVGFIFHGCSEGKALLPLLGRVQPDLILLDVEMPELDGFELCRALRQRPETARTPILFVTGRNSHADLQRALAVGGNDFVVKPYDPTKLRARIAQWIQRAAKEAGVAPNAPQANAPQPNIVQAKPAPSAPVEVDAHPSILQELRRGVNRMPDAPAPVPPTTAPQRPVEKR